MRHFTNTRQDIRGRTVVLLHLMYPGSFLGRPGIRVVFGSRKQIVLCFYIIQLSEDLSFLNKASIMHMTKLIPNDVHVIIDASKSKNIDIDVMEILEDFKLNAKTRDITLDIVGLTNGKKKEKVSLFSDSMFNHTEKLKTKTKFYE